MKFDENLVSQNLEELNKTLRKISDIMEKIEKANDDICNYENWESPVCEEYKSKLKDMKENFLIIDNRFLNIRNFVDTVIGNYMEIDRSHGKLYNQRVVK